MSEKYTLSEMVETEAVLGPDWSIFTLPEDKIAKKGDKIGATGRITVGRKGTRTAANRERIRDVIAVGGCQGSPYLHGKGRRATFYPQKKNVF